MDMKQAIDSLRDYRDHMTRPETNTRDRFDAIIAALSQPEPAVVCPHYYEDTDGVHIVVVGRCRCNGKTAPAPVAPAPAGVVCRALKACMIDVHHRCPDWPNGCHGTSMAGKEK